MPIIQDPSRLEILFDLTRKINGFGILGESYQEMTEITADLTQSLGSSIPLFEEETLHISERFFQVERHLALTRGGMGLGLSVWNVIYAHRT